MRREKKTALIAIAIFILAILSSIIHDQLPSDMTLLVFLTAVTSIVTFIASMVLITIAVVEMLDKV